MADTGAGRYWVETLGCPKNQVDSDKLTGTLHAEGLAPAADPREADLIVVNTCAFVEDARRESVEVILDLAGHRRDGARLVVTGCLAERSGPELAAALGEVDLVAPFGQPVVPAPTGSRRTIPVSAAPVPAFDLLQLPRPPATGPWAYVKVAEGCDRRCGFCAIPSFRGPQRSRPSAAILAEIEDLGVREVVLVAQDLAAYGRDQGVGQRSIVPLVRAAAERVERVRLLYLYPSDLTDELVDTMIEVGMPYFDLSLQHVSGPLLRRMRRWGDGERFRSRIGDIRRRAPEATFRSNFIVGYPGETEADHDELLRFVEEVGLDWCGAFPFSREEGTLAAGLDGEVAPSLRDERLAELRELSDAVTARRRDALVGQDVEVLVDEPRVGRSHREAPEIDGIVALPPGPRPGDLVEVRVTAATGPDLEAVPR